MEEFKDFDGFEAMVHFNLEKPNKPSKRRKVQEKRNEVVVDQKEDYELAPRNTWKESEKLPVKTDSGWKEVTSHVSDPVKPERKSDEVQKPEKPTEAKNGSTKAPVTSKYDSSVFEVFKENLAEDALSLTEDPEENIDKLGKMIRLTKTSKDKKSLKITILTLFELFKDLVPGYSIRQLTEEEKAAKVSMQVKKLRKFEQALVRHYKDFVFILRDISKQHESLSVKFIAFKSLCGLAAANSHFNYFQDILECVLSRIHLKDPRIANLCSETFSTVFTDDELGKNSCLITEKLADRLASLEYRIDPVIISCLLNLRLRTEFSFKSQSEQQMKKTKFVKKHLSKKQKKERKVTKQVSKEIKEAEAVVTKEEKSRWHSHTLQHLFRIYFTVLKKSSDDSILPPVLEGISRYSHLIGIEYFADLLANLKAMTMREIGLHSTLQCVLTIFQVYSVQEDLNFDLKHYYILLYQSLLMKQTEKTISLTERCLENLFLKQDSVPSKRVTSFILRLADSALNCQSDLQKTVWLKWVCMLLSKYPQTRCILDKDDILGSGLYSSKTNDPDLANPFSRFLDISQFPSETQATIKSLK